MPHQLVLKYLSSKANVVFNQTLFMLFREIYCYDSFKLFLKTLLKELFANKDEILSCKSSKPCENRKNSWAYYTRTRDKSGSNSPPLQGNIQIPPPPRPGAQANARGMGGGGGVEMLKLQFDQYINPMKIKRN